MYLYIDESGDAFFSPNREPDGDDLKDIEAQQLRCFEFRIGEGVFEASADVTEDDAGEEAYSAIWHKVPQT